MRFGVDPGPEADFPDVVGHVWNWFWRLSNRRQQSQSGPQPLSYSEIDAWCRRMRVLITPAEIEMIMAMDDAYLSANSVEIRDSRARQQNNAPKPKKRYS